MIYNERVRFGDIVSFYTSIVGRGVTPQPPPRTQTKLLLIYASRLTLGLVPPAKPAFIDDVPQSMTMGWFNMAAAEEVPPEEEGAFGSMSMV